MLDGTVAKGKTQQGEMGIPISHSTKPKGLQHFTFHITYRPLVETISLTQTIHISSLLSDMPLEGANSTLY